MKHKNLLFISLYLALHMSTVMIEAMQKASTGIPISERYPRQIPMNFFSAGKAASLVMEFMLAERQNSQDIYLKSSKEDLENIIAIAKNVISENTNYSMVLINLGSYGTDRDDLKSKFSSIKQKAENALAMKRVEPEKMTSKFPETQTVLFFSGSKYGLLMHKFTFNEIKNSPETYTDSSTADLEELIDLIKFVFEKPFLFDLAFSRFSHVDKESFKKQLDNILKKAEAELAQRKIKPQAPLLPILKQSEGQPMQIPVQALPLPQTQQAPLQVEFSNHNSDKLVTAWVQTSPDNKWDMVKLLPFKDSQSMILVKGSVTHFYVGPEAFVLIPQENAMILSKEVLHAEKLDAQEIKRIDLKYPAKLLVIVNPDSSIALKQIN